MEIQFNQEITTKVPTCCLIENYQDLMRAIQSGDWELVKVVADCLSDTISDYTTVPDSLDIKPSVTSLIAMSCESGIILDKNGRDIRCVAGKAVSEVKCCGDVCCCEECLNAYGCDPEHGFIQLGKADGAVFDFTKPEESLIILEILGEPDEDCLGQ